MHIYAQNNNGDLQQLYTYYDYNHLFNLENSGGMLVSRLGLRFYFMSSNGLSVYRLIPADFQGSSMLLNVCRTNVTHIEADLHELEQTLLVSQNQENSESQVLSSLNAQIEAIHLQIAQLRNNRLIVMNIASNHVTYLERQTTTIQLILNEVQQRIELVNATLNSTYNRINQIAEDKKRLNQESPDADLPESESEYFTVPVIFSGVVVATAAIAIGGYVLTAIINHKTHQLATEAVVRITTHQMLESSAVLNKLYVSPGTAEEEMTSEH